MNNESGKDNDNAVDSVGGCEPVVVGDKCPECGFEDVGHRMMRGYGCEDPWHDQALKQKDLDPEVADFINENFHDLLEAPKQGDTPERRLDDLMAKAFDTDHPAMHDWALIKMELKSRRIPETKQDDEANLKAFNDWYNPQRDGWAATHLDSWNAAIARARKSDDEVIRRLEDLSVDDLPERFREWHRGYFAMVELYAAICPGWATDGTIRHMVGNIKSRLKEERKSDDRLKEAERLLKLSRGIMQTSGLSPRHALYREISACLKSINEQEDK